MQKTNSKTILYSNNCWNIKLATLELLYPRIIHAELLTHRDFSRNAASSRAIPSLKMINAIREDMFIPKHIQKDHSGMQGSSYLSVDQTKEYQKLWENAAHFNIWTAWQMTKELGATKQMNNRMLEWCQWYKSLVSSTQWDNFYELRNSKYIIQGEGYSSQKEAIERYPYMADFSELDWLEINKGDAEIHFRELAENIYVTLNGSEAKMLKEGEWHTPYADMYADLENTKEKIKVSSSKSAQTSYTVIGIDGKPSSKERLFEIHDGLIDKRHSSPLEHPSRVMFEREFFTLSRKHLSNNISERLEKEQTQGITTINDSTIDGWKYVIEEFGWCDNFRGWIQYRNIVKNKGLIN